MGILTQTWVFSELVGRNWSLIPLLDLSRCWRLDPTSSMALRGPFGSTPATLASPLSFLTVLRESALEFGHSFAFFPCGSQRHSPGECEWYTPQALNPGGQHVYIHCGCFQNINWSPAHPSQGLVDVRVGLVISVC